MKTLITLFTCSLAAVSAAEKPNVIFIFADDMGLGETGHGGSLVATPNIDKLAKEGMRFNDAHTSSAVCTPSRYSLLTGRYAWRTRLKKHVFFSALDKPLIEKGRPTIATLLKKQGYQTAMIGKWHLGIDWKLVDKTKVPAKLKPKKTYDSWFINYSKPFTGGPIDNGFDSFFGILSSLDMPPYVYLRDNKAEQLPTVNKKWLRLGAAAKDFDASTCLADFAKESRAFIATAAKKDKPFFLYLPLTSPHTPISPGKKFKGTSKYGEYGDFLSETDWVVGEILKQLDQSQIKNDTIVFFSSDNGFAPYVKIPKLTKAGQKPSQHFRGYKSDIYEGGHRVPFIVRWPNKIKPNSVSKHTLCLSDTYATLAEITSQNQVPATASEDSFSFLPSLLNQAQQERPYIIHHAFHGDFAIRQGDWKLIVSPGSGGWSKPKTHIAIKDINAPLVQLYNLRKDPSETTNLHEKHPVKVKELIQLLANSIKTGRSTPGPNQQNDGSIPFEKRMLKRFPELKN